MSCIRKEADRLESSQRIVVQLSQMRTDDEIRRIQQQGAAIGHGARCSFGSYYRARSRAILDDHHLPLHPSDLLRQQAGQNVDATTRGKWNDDLDCFRNLRLTPCTVSGQSDENDGSCAPCEFQKLTALKFHCVAPPIHWCNHDRFPP
jgi:hypothetical protein